MQWLTLTLFGTATIASMLAVTIATANYRRTSATLRLLSAQIADACMRLSEIERTERLTPSKLAELADVQDAIGKGNALLKRINSREVMRERNQRNGIGNLDLGVNKDDLRRQAGLVAGKPAPHR